MPRLPMAFPGSARRLYSVALALTLAWPCLAVLPPAASTAGAHPPRALRHFPIASDPRQAEAEVSFYVVTIRGRTAVSLSFDEAPGTLRSFQVTADGRPAGRIDAVLASGFGPEPTAFLELGPLPDGLHRIGLIPVHASPDPDEDPPRGGFHGQALVRGGRIVDLSAILEGLALLYETSAQVYLSLATFDHDVRAGPPGPAEAALARLAQQMVHHGVQLEDSPQVQATAREVSYLHHRAWHAPAGIHRLGTLYGHVLTDLSRGWNASGPRGRSKVAHEIYRSNPDRAYLAGGLTDLSLSRRNLAQAFRLAARRPGGLFAAQLAALRDLLSQDSLLCEALETSIERARGAIDRRVTRILETSPDWREKTPLAYETVLRGRKAPPPEYPSRPVVKHEERVLVGYLETVARAASLDRTFTSVVGRLLDSYREPLARLTPVPRWHW